MHSIWSLPKCIFCKVDSKFKYERYFTKLIVISPPIQQLSLPETQPRVGPVGYLVDYIRHLRNFSLPLTLILYTPPDTFATFDFNLLILFKSTSPHDTNQFWSILPPLHQLTFLNVLLDNGRRFDQWQCPSLLLFLEGYKKIRHSIQNTKDVLFSGKNQLFPSLTCVRRRTIAWHGC